jgi:hypothetical protein
VIGGLGSQGFHTTAAAGNDGTAVVVGSARLIRTTGVIGPALTSSGTLGSATPLFRSDLSEQLATTTGHGKLR